MDSCKRKLVQFFESMKKLGRDDPRRIIHSLKVGLALTLVSLLYYLRPLYHAFGFGSNCIWAILTVVVVFEFSVGATVSKALNRGVGTFLGGALGVGVQYFARLFGPIEDPIILSIFVILLVFASTFFRFVPRIKTRYDYGVVIFILTFCLVTVSGYRVEKILELADQRLFTILIGGATCVFISIFICPIWDGETLHKDITSNIEKLADYLEGNIVVVSNSSLEAYKTLTSRSSEESLANFASWEPRHGKFSFLHPWKHYLEIGSLTRQCANQIEGLNRNIYPTNIQVVMQFRRRIEESSKAISSESGKALRVLASSIKTMKNLSSSSKNHIENAKIAIDELTTTIKCGYLESSDLPRIFQDAIVCCILTDIVESVEKISEAIDVLSRSAGFKSGEPSNNEDHVVIMVDDEVEFGNNEALMEPTMSPMNSLQLLNREIVNSSSDDESGDRVITVVDDQLEMGKNQTLMEPTKFKSVELTMSLERLEQFQIMNSMLSDHVVLEMKPSKWEILTVC